MQKETGQDAQLLARLARVDPQLLRPIQHRSEKAQQDRMKIRVRAALVGTRTSLVKAARGLTKGMGDRLPACDTDSMGVERMAGLPAGLQETLKPLLEQVESLTKKIKECAKELEQIARTEYPETCLLQQSKLGAWCSPASSIPNTWLTLLLPAFRSLFELRRTAAIQF